MIKRPTLYVIAGSNGAGKSTITRTNLPKDVYIVNPDVIVAEKKVSAIQAGKEAIRIRQKLLNENATFAIETTLSGRGEIAFLKQAKEKGYKILMTYVGIKNSKQSEYRVKRRTEEGGHSIPIEDIKRRYSKSLDNLSEAIKYADRVIVIDNSLTKPKLILYYSNKQEVRRSRSLPEWAKPVVQKNERKKTIKI